MLSSRYIVSTRRASLPESGFVGHSLDTASPSLALHRWGGAITIRSLDVAADALAYAHGNRAVRWGDDLVMEAIPHDPGPQWEDGAVEINLLLPKKPPTNVFRFAVSGDEAFDWNFQPALTADEIAEGVNRPENVIGSYAIYHKRNRWHRIGGVNYGCGKAFHVFRPFAYDARGKTVWCNLRKQRGRLALIVPQLFLDDAAYPVTVDPNLGYTTIGGTSTGGGDGINRARLAASYAATENGTITSLFWYGSLAAGTANIKLGAYSGTSPYSLVTGSATADIAASTAAQWWTAASGGSLTSGTNYSIAMAYSTQTMLYRYDTVAGFTYYQDNADGYALPATFTQSGTASSRKVSAYVAYTAAGGGAAPKPGLGHMMTTLGVG